MSVTSFPDGCSTDAGSYLLAALATTQSAGMGAKPLLRRVRACICMCFSFFLPSRTKEQEQQQVGR